MRLSNREQDQLRENLEAAYQDWLAKGNEPAQLPAPGSGHQLQWDQRLGSKAVRDMAKRRGKAFKINKE